MIIPAPAVCRRTNVHQCLVSNELDGATTVQLSCLNALVTCFHDDAGWTERSAVPAVDVSRLPEPRRCGSLLPAYTLLTGIRRFNRVGNAPRFFRRKTRPDGHAVKRGHFSYVFLRALAASVGIADSVADAWSLHCGAAGFVTAHKKTARKNSRTVCVSWWSLRRSGNCFLATTSLRIEADSSSKQNRKARRLRHGRRRVRNVKKDK